MCLCRPSISGPDKDGFTSECGIYTGENGMHLVVGAAVLPSDAWVIVGGGQLQLHVSPVIMDPRREQVTFSDPSGFLH